MDTRNVILTLARIWSTAATGVIRSKDTAADWALERLPPRHRPALAPAPAISLGDHSERWNDVEDRIERHADDVIAALRGLVET